MQIHLCFNALFFWFKSWGIALLLGPREVLLLPTHPPVGPPLNLTTSEMKNNCGLLYKLLKKETSKCFRYEEIYSCAALTFMFACVLY